MRKFTWSFTVLVATVAAAWVSAWGPPWNIPLCLIAGGLAGNYFARRLQLGAA